MQIVLEGKTLGDCAKQAENFLNEFDGGEAESTPNPSAVSPPSTRQRGRRTNQQIVADAQAAATAKGNGAAAPTPIASAPSANKLTLPQVQQAMRELIAHMGQGDVQKGAVFVKAMMEKEFVPHMRATELPEPLWEKFVSRCAELTAPAAAQTADSLI